MNYNMKCYFEENEKVFGNIIVTTRTLDGSYNVYNGQYPVVHTQSDWNLVHQTLETPDFMALNSPITKNCNKRRIKNATSSSESCESKIDSTKNCTTIHSHQYHHIKDGCAKKQRIYPLPVVRESHDGIVVSSLVDQLLLDIYRYPRYDRERSESESTVSSFRPRLKHRYLQRTRLQLKSTDELSVVLETLQTHINHAGGLLIRQLRRRDYLCIKRDRQYDVITAHLQAHSNQKSMEVRE